MGRKWTDLWLTFRCCSVAWHGHSVLNTTWDYPVTCSGQCLCICEKTWEDPYWSSCLTSCWKIEFLTKAQWLKYLLSLVWFFGNHNLFILISKTLVQCYSCSEWLFSPLWRECGEMTGSTQIAAINSPFLVYIYPSSSVKVYFFHRSRASCWNTEQWVPSGKWLSRLTQCVSLCVAVWKVMLQAVKRAHLWTSAVAIVVSQWPTVEGWAPTTWTASSTDTSYCPATHGPAAPSSSTLSPSFASRQRRRLSNVPVRCQRAMSSHQIYRTSR